jgi:Hemerythrin HHE cation binding domain
MHKEFFEVLHKDHELFKDILLKLKQLASTESKRREELFGEFKLEIEPHTKAEEEVFYPPLKENKESYEDVLESFEEHHVISLILGELDLMPKQLDQWRAKLRVCKEVVEHHIVEEEDKIFKAATKLLSRDQMQTIFEGFLRERERLKNSMR